VNLREVAPGWCFREEGHYDGNNNSS
jgi:hypothetical protein